MGRYVQVLVRTCGIEIQPGSICGEDLREKLVGAAVLCYVLPLSGSKWKDDVRFTGLSRQGYRQPGILKLETGRDQMSTLARVRLDHFSTAVAG